jgi:RNA polymerase sigma-70 factor (ECF subfamily)
MCDREDRDLVARLQHSDEAAFATLIDRHTAALRRTALAFVSTAASADEVVQDTWLAVIAGLPAFEGRSSIKTWIFGILINRARTRGVREARIIPTGDAACEVIEPTEPTDTPKNLLLRKELTSALLDAIRSLPDRQRAVFALRALGWSCDEVCDALDLSEINQRVLLHRARLRLRAILGHYQGGRDVELPRYERARDRLARRRAHAG